jgi:hypothetical protein
MITLIAAAVLAAQTPAAPANPQAQHEQHMQMGQAGEHKGMDCCKDCCKDMDAKHEGHDSAHAEHGGR